MGCRVNKNERIKEVNKEHVCMCEGLEESCWNIFWNTKLYVVSLVVCECLF